MTLMVWSTFWQHGGLEEVAGAGRALAAGEHLGAAVHGLFDLKFDEVDGLALGERANVGRGVLGVAHFVFLHFGDIGVDEFREQGTHHVDSFDGATALAGIVEGAVHEVGHGEIEIRVFADQRRIFAAEFQAHVEQLPGGLFVDFAAAYPRNR